LGREELERKLKNWKMTATVDETAIALAKYLKIKSATELFVRIEAEQLDMAYVKELVLRYQMGELFEPKVPPPHTHEKHIHKPEKDSGDALIIEDSLSGLEYKMGKCCNPVFGDDIFGFTTVSSGITIHRSDCPNAKRLREQYSYRILPARWRSNAAASGFIASIRVVAEDRTGMVNRITELIGELKINIRSMNLVPMRAGRIGGLINIEVANTGLVDMVAANLLKVRGMEKAYRVTG
jgi:GTP pyrophosphokinase